MLTLARIIWADDVARFEDSLFESIGLGGGAKFLIIVPLAIWCTYWLFKRELGKAHKRAGKRFDLKFCSFHLACSR